MTSIFARFFGRTVSEAAGVAAGIAVASPLRPVVQLVENETWALHPDKPVPAPLAAAIVAEDVERQAWGETQASYTGFAKDSFDAMLGEALNAPGVPQLFEAWRRNLIDDAGFTHGLRKAKLETRWDAPLKALKARLLSLDELANARQQGFVSTDRQRSESALQGLDQERADVLYELTGLPPGAAEAQSLLNRGLIDEALFAQIIREGHTKTKYTDLLRQAARFVLSPINYVEGRLRGWLTDAEMYAGTALHGVTQADTDLLFKIHGRPISFHQVWIGLQRGGALDGPTDQIHPAFLASLRRSSIQPAFYNLAWAQRYTYPSAFVMRALVQTGVLTQAQGEADLIDMGWRPDRAKQVSTAWATGTAAKGDTHTAKAQTQLWSTLHRSYLAGESTAPEVTAALPRAGVAASAVADVLATWDEERTIIRKQLSPAQVKKAYVEGVLNLDTGVAWTKDEATAALVARGYSTADATTFLEL